MTIMTTRLANLEEGTKFRTSANSAFYFVDGYDRLSRRYHITASNGDICQMRPKMKVYVHDEASY
jgi:hypothetical protein